MVSSGVFGGHEDEERGVRERERDRCIYCFTLSSIHNRLMERFDDYYISLLHLHNSLAYLI